MGRAVGTYRLGVGDSPTQAGRVIFAVERVNGEPRIVLIATQAASGS